MTTTLCSWLSNICIFSEHALLAVVWLNDALAVPTPRKQTKEFQFKQRRTKATKGLFLIKKVTGQLFYHLLSYFWLSNRSTKKAYSQNHISQGLVSPGSKSIF